jgi:isoleucyl-tRNA synthetase
MLKPVSAKVSLSEVENEVLEFWKKDKTFEKSISSRPKDKRWTFLDGPPFVTGMPHYGSLLSSLPKDLFGRYYTMKGFRVRRVWGWDGHGLPIENKVEGKLHIKRKRDIEEIVGVQKFIDECKRYVEQVSSEWEWYVNKIGRWVDFENAYKTWDISYMESVMWVFKQMYKKGYVYKGLRVSLYCPHDSTPISNFEVAMDAENHKEVTEYADTYKYKVGGENDAYFLAWSTTPWNKLVTPALAVNPKFLYVKVKQGSEYYILAKSTLNMLKQDIPYEVIEEFKGTELVGKRFEPQYDFYISFEKYKKEIASGKKVFIIVGGDFVTADEGTGIVTLAAYGEEDMEVMKKENILVVTHVDDEGMINEDVPKFGGMFYLDANEAVNQDLKERNLLYDQKPYTHSIPFCWRCGTRLFYNPQNAWYINVQDLKAKMKETNEKVNWFPKHFKYGRFLKSLENAPDWNISRSRYWGSPVPVWECECGENFVPGSIKELEEVSGKIVTDLHKPVIDKIEITCKKCAQKVKRVTEVLDSWIEAGSASFAERHFPFENEELNNFFPPDFVAEYTGQIRAWFYVMHVLGAALYDSPAFKNAVVEGVILGTDGRKMSKNYGNFPDPKMLIENYGGDALRMYLLGSPVMNGEDIRISEVDYRDQVRGTLLILWNTYNFFLMYAEVDGWKPESSNTATKNPLDLWVLSLLNRFVKEVGESLDRYDTVNSINLFKKFVNELSTWYVRRSRDRVGPSGTDKNDKNAFYETIYEVFVTTTKVIAPIVPFISESIYKNLTDLESVHLEYWPQFQQDLINSTLENEMLNAQELCTAINSLRKQSNVKVKIPLKELSYKGPLEFSESILKIVKDEVNVEQLKYIGKSDVFEVLGETSESNQNLEAGKARDIIRKIQIERKRLGTGMSQMVNVALPSWPQKYEEEIKKRAMVKNLLKSDGFSVTAI